MIFGIKQRKLKYFIFLFIFLFLFSITSFLERKPLTSKSADNIMYVHYINVGQGDSILIQVNNKNMLIDSGPKTHKKKLIKFLNSLNISSLDYVIATHPHDDHIGNMSTILHTYKVNSFYAPKVYSNTKLFEQMIDSLKSKNLKINTIKRGCNSIDLGKGVYIDVFSPLNDTYDNENNYSPIMKISFGKTSFLFTGDAEKEIESSIISLNDNINADVLKAGHHGSSTSTSDSFLTAVSPKYTIISVGKNNMYGHPSKDIIEKLNKRNIYTLRTDKKNNITFISDGNELKIKYS